MGDLITIINPEEHDALDDSYLTPTGIDGLDWASPTYEDLDFYEFLKDAVSGDIFTGELDVEFSVSPDGCQICFWVKLRVSIWKQATGWGFCQTLKKCLEPPPPPPPPDWPPGIPKPPPLPGYATEVVATSKVDYQLLISSRCPKGSSSDLSRPSSTYRHTLYLTGNEAWKIHKRSETLTTRGKCKKGVARTLLQQNNFCTIDLVDSLSGRRVYRWGVDFFQGQSGYISGSSGDIRNIDALFGTYPTSFKPIKPPPEPNFPPPPYFEVDNDMKCCRNQRDNEALLRKIAQAVGIKDFPASLPKSYLNNIGGQTRILSIPQMVAHLFLNVDAVLGSFPLDIEIEDIDPETKGQQTRKIEIENLAEGIAELFALSVKTSVDADNILEGLLRLIPEVLSTKAATLIAQSYARANADFLGYKGNEDVQKVPINFKSDLEGAENLTGLFQSEKVDIKVWKNESKESLMDYLQRLMFAAGLVKASLLHNDSSDLTYTLEDEVAQKAAEDAASEDFQMTWDRFVELVNTDGVFNRSEGAPRPKAREVPARNLDLT